MVLLTGDTSTLTQNHATRIVRLTIPDSVGRLFFRTYANISISVLPCKLYCHGIGWNGCVTFHSGDFIFATQLDGGWGKCAYRTLAQYVYADDSRWP